MFSKREDKEDEEPVRKTDDTLVVPCPWHNLPLKVQTEEREVVDLENLNKDKNAKKKVTVKFAVCNCKVDNNTHVNQRAWEQV